MRADIYIETSLSWNQVRDGVVGIAISIYDPEDAKTFFGRVQKCSESAAVLYGIKNALNYISKADEICLNISCVFVANAFINGWPYAWNDNGFKNNKGKEIQNRDIWEDILVQLKERRVIVKLNEFNGYRNWLKAECARRARKYESPIQRNLSNCKKEV